MATSAELQQPGAPPRSLSRQTMLAVAAILALAIFRFWFGAFDVWHPDEVIATGVIEGMRQRGDLDTNWALADLPAVFRYEQYNFSAWILSGHLWTGLLGWFGQSSPPAEGVLLGQLRAFSVFCSIAAGAGLFWIGCVHFGRTAAFAALGLFMFAPLLVQDALYARPETFVTALVMLVAGMTLSRSLVFQLASFVVLGILIATKFSMLPLLAGPAVSVIWGQVAGRSRDWPMTGARLAAAGFAALLLTCLGFALGVPGAIAHPDVFLSGVDSLRNQYGGLHPPHGAHDPAPLKSVFWAAGYFAATCGALAIAVMAGGAFAAVKRNQRVGLVLLAMTAPSLIVLLPNPVFFERNYSHLLALGCVFFGVGVAAARSFVAARAGERAGVGAALGLMAMVLVAPGIVDSRLAFDVLPGRAEVRVNAQIAAVSTACGLGDTAWRTVESDRQYADVLAALRADARPLLFSTRYHKGGFTRHYADLLSAEPDIEYLGRVVGPLDDLPASTMSVYFVGGARMFWYGPTGSRPDGCVIEGR